MPAKDAHLRDRALLLLINGMTIEAAEGYCVQQGLDQDSAKGVVQDARKRLTVAADYARDEQLGRAVMRLDDLYAKSIAGQDIGAIPPVKDPLRRPPWRPGVLAVLLVSELPSQNLQRILAERKSLSDLISPNRIPSKRPIYMEGALFPRPSGLPLCTLNAVQSPQLARRGGATTVHCASPLFDK